MYKSNRMADYRMKIMNTAFRGQSQLHQKYLEYNTVYIFFK